MFRSHRKKQFSCGSILWTRGEVAAGSLRAFRWLDFELLIGGNRWQSNFPERLKLRLFLLLPHQISYNVG